MDAGLVATLAVVLVVTVTLAVITFRMFSPSRRLGFACSIVMGVVSIVGAVVASTGGAPVFGALAGAMLGFALFWVTLFLYEGRAT